MSVERSLTTYDKTMPIPSYQDWTKEIQILNQPSSVTRQDMGDFNLYLDAPKDYPHFLLGIPSCSTSSFGSSLKSCREFEEIRF